MQLSNMEVGVFFVRFFNYFMMKMGLDGLEDYMVVVVILLFVILLCVCIVLGYLMEEFQYISEFVIVIIFVSFFEIVRCDCNLY